MQGNDQRRPYAFGLCLWRDGLTLMLREGIFEFGIGIVPDPVVRQFYRDNALG